jgi:XTP/dITP diphosphohydrolase
LGEDSGIVVDALAGAPGVYSARYSGPAATDQSNNDKLLAVLSTTPLEKRTAHYFCALALADPTGEVRVEDCGTRHGRIRFEPVGTTGFGYDPLFEILEYHRTFAELGGAVKHVLSHRARAVEALLPRLIELFGPQVASPRTSG